MANLFSYLTDVLRQSPPRVQAFVNSLDDATAAKLMSAAEAGDNRALLAAMSEQTWGLAPARQAPAAAPASGSRDPMSFEERVANDPKIRRAIEASGGTVPAGDVEAIMRAYRGTAPRRGRPRSAEDSIRELSKPADQVAAEGIASQFDRAASNPLLEKPFHRPEDGERLMRWARQQWVPADIASQFDRASASAGPDLPDAWRSRAHRVAKDSYPAEYDIGPEDLMSPDILGGMTPQYRQLLQELNNNDWLGFDYPSQAVSSALAYGDAPTRWEMTPGLLDARDAFIRAHGREVPARGGAQSPSALIPFSPRGSGVPVGGPSGPAALVDPGTEMIPAPLRGVGGQTRALSAAPEVDVVMPSRGRASQDPSGVRPYRVVDEARPASGRGRAAATAAAAGVGAGLIHLMNQGGNDFTTGGEAELADESRPAPRVAAEPPADYSMQARALINKLNDMRRAAGGEVPEAPAMMKEIDRLLALGNQTRRATAVAAPQDDAGRLYQQAQALIDQVNQMYRRGMSPNSPEVQRIMSQVRQLQAQGDAIRNRRVG